MFLATETESKDFGMDFWAQVMEVRMAVSRELERLRVAGGIGASLDAEVDLYCGREIQDKLARLEDELRFVLITSAARVAAIGGAPAGLERTALAGGGEVAVAVAASVHAKCERCWHRREDVGEHAAHPALCGRCIGNIAGDEEARRYA